MWWWKLASFAFALNINQYIACAADVDLRIEPLLQFLKAAARARRKLHTVFARIGSIAPQHAQTMSAVLQYRQFHTCGDFRQDSSFRRDSRSPLGFARR